MEQEILNDLQAIINKIVEYRKNFETHTPMERVCSISIRIIGDIWTYWKAEVDKQVKDPKINKE